MLVIKINEENTPEVRDALSKIIAAFNVVSFVWEDEVKSVPPEIRSGATGKDLSSAVSAAVDKVTHAKPV